MPTHKGVYTPETPASLVPNKAHLHDITLVHGSLINHHEEGHRTHRHIRRPATGSKILM